MKLADEGMSALFPEKNVLVTKCVERRPEVGKDSFRIGKQIPKIRVLSQDQVVEQLETSLSLTNTSAPKLPIGK